VPVNGGFKPELIAFDYVLTSSRRVLIVKSAQPDNAAGTGKKTMKQYNQNQPRCYKNR
jgi:hypothetical protein